MLAPYSNSTTSKDAAEAVCNAAALREGVLNLLKLNPEGLTDEQIQDSMGLNGNTQRPRRWELVNAGLVIRKGTRTVRSGHKAIVWAAANGEESNASRGIRLEVTVTNSDGVIEYDLAPVGSKDGQSVTFKFPEAVTIYSGDTVKFAWKFTSEVKWPTS